MTSRKIQYWVIPPDCDAEFAASMEEVLETYAKPYDSKNPVLCMDEQPVQFRFVAACAALLMFGSPEESRNAVVSHRQLKDADRTAETDDTAIFFV